MVAFAYDEQVRSQATAVAEALRQAEVPHLDPERRVLFSGIGTSWHACRVAAYWALELSRGAVNARAVEAHELALHGPLGPGDQLVVVSHRGTKRFPNQVIERARAGGASTILVTGWGRSDPEADVVLRTCPDERAGTHTVSYLSALAVLAKLVAALVGPSGDGFAKSLEAVPAAIERTLAEPAPTSAAEQIQNRAPILVTGFGIDAITAEEAALKLKEGAYLWAEGMSEEMALHGTPAVFDNRMGATLITPGRDDGGRSRELRALLLELGLTVLTCGVGSADLPFPEVEYLLRPFVSIVPLQRLVGELARLRGSNPDSIRADQAPWSVAVPKVRL